MDVDINVSTHVRVCHTAGCLAPGAPLGSSTTQHFACRRPGAEGLALRTFDKGFICFFLFFSLLIFIRFSFLVKLRRVLVAPESRDPFGGELSEDALAGSSKPVV